MNKTPPQRPLMPTIQKLIAAYKLWNEYFDHLPKKSRYTIGSKVDLLFIETAQLLFTASALPKEQKLSVIQKAVINFDLLKFFLQIAWEIKVLENKKYVAISEQLSEVGRMIGGWHKQLTNQTPLK